MKTITQDELSRRSSEVAELEHHKNCEYECCGEHNNFEDYDICPKCKMTPDIQEKHNDEIWAIIDDEEAKILNEYKLVK